MAGRRTFAEVGLEIMSPGITLRNVLRRPWQTRGPPGAALLVTGASDAGGGWAIQRPAVAAIAAVPIAAPAPAAAPAPPPPSSSAFTLLVRRFAPGRPVLAVTLVRFLGRISGPHGVVLVE